MRKYLYLLLFGLMCCEYTYPQSSKVKRLIDKFDVIHLVESNDDARPERFWGLVHDNNKSFKDIAKAIGKREESIQLAVEAIDAAQKYNNEHDNIACGYDSISNRIIANLGLDKINNGIPPIKFIQEEYINASMDAKGQMRINSGAADKLSYEELMAVCSHEAAHYACLHILAGVWKKAKKYYRNRTWANIGAGLFIGATAAASAYSASVGYEDKASNYYLKHADFIFQGAYIYADHATEKFSFRYTREQELEADIIAYRFMEYIGLSGEHLISAFKKIALLYGDSPSGTYDDHPSLSFRIEVLEAMQNGYVGKSKKK